MSFFEREDVRRLAEALLTLETEEDAVGFLEDLLTYREIQDAAQRLEVARLLRKGEAYQEIIGKTGASSATISRVNRALTYGPGGYGTVLSRMEGNGEKK